MFSTENITRTVTAEEISTWKVQELKNFCKEHKIKGYSKLRKTELIALVTDFVKTHDEAKTETKSQLSVKPAPLTEKFAKTAVPGMSEYVKRKKLAEEKEYLRCWRSYLLSLKAARRAN
ncbi:MAG: Rho termination factor N-terminal domain-containing protein [Synergistaceae bacterium]|nr:Rho termination factor N-terminal domain-containing protein [Synergistaceae bacterium]